MSFQPLVLRMILLTGYVTILAAQPPADKADSVAKVPQAPPRIFTLTYATRITGLTPGKAAHIWLPIATSSPDQKVEVVSRKVPQFERASMGREPEYGNEIYFLEAKADAKGEIAVQINYKVTRFEVRGNQGKTSAEAKAVLERFLKPDTLVPIDGKPLELLKDQTLPADKQELMRKLYEVVNDHLKYSKEKPGWGRGDSAWACDSKTGNCSDFHSLFISLARSRQVPAKFEIGFSLPAKTGAGPIMGYHCWAKFYLDNQGWMPVDISEANKDPKMKEYYFGNLTTNRVAFSTGRDLKLVPEQKGPPINFFIFPYAEVEGKPWPTDKINTKISFKDE